MHACKMEAKPTEAWEDVKKKRAGRRYQVLVNSKQQAEIDTAVLTSYFWRLSYCWSRKAELLKQVVSMHGGWDGLSPAGNPVSGVAGALCRGACSRPDGAAR